MSLFVAKDSESLGLLRGFLRLPSCFQVTNEVTMRVFSKSKMQHKEGRIQRMRPSLCQNRKGKAVSLSLFCFNGNIFQYKRSGT